MPTRLINVRLDLDAERLRKAQQLRRNGVVLSQVVREAIDKRFDELRASNASRDIDAMLDRIYQAYPAPADLPVRDYDVTRLPGSTTPDFRTDVFSWLSKYGEHDPDWADACLAVLSGRHRDARVWTYDREFRTTWRRPDGRAIPVFPS